MLFRSSGYCIGSCSNTALASLPSFAMLTIHPQPSSKSFIPSRIISSLSITRIGKFSGRDEWVGVVGATDSFLAPRTESGTSNEKCEPRPGSDRSFMGCFKRREIRSTIDRPKPKPRATLSPSSRRLNSLKIEFFCSAGIPSPVSMTLMMILSRLRRQLRAWCGYRQRQTS